MRRSGLQRACCLCSRPCLELCIETSEQCIAVPVASFGTKHHCLLIERQTGYSVRGSPAYIVPRRVGVQAPRGGTHSSSTRSLNARVPPWRFGPIRTVTTTLRSHLCATLHDVCRVAARYATSPLPAASIRARWAFVEATSASTILRASATNWCARPSEIEPQGVRMPRSQWT
jgi:hypothetical protein